MAHDHVIAEHIWNIIQKHKIHEQVDLQKMLKERGYDVPQATLSRRLKKMKIAKVGGAYQPVELNTPNLPIVLNIQISDFGIIILHTSPGNASSLAFFLDQKYVTYSPQSSGTSGILGTIAGDDTILLIIKSKTDLPHVLEILQAEFPYLLMP